MTALVEMEQFVDLCSDIFMTRLGEFADQKATFDLGHWLQCYAVFILFLLYVVNGQFDVIGEITFAKRFGFLDKGEDINGLMKGIDAYLSYGAKVGMIPELHYPLMRFFEILSRGKPGGPMLPVFEVAFLFTIKLISSSLRLDLRNGKMLKVTVETFCRDFSNFTEKSLIPSR